MELLTVAKEMRECLTGDKDTLYVIPREAEFLPPLIDDLTEQEIAVLHSKYELDSKRAVVVMPYVNSRANLPESFWEFFAAEIGIGDFLALTTNAPIFDVQCLGAWSVALKINYPVSPSTTGLVKRNGFVMILNLLIMLCFSTGLKAKM